MKANLGFRLAGMVLAVWATAPAQPLIGPERVAAARSAFDSASRAARLRCEVHSVQPALTYALQLQAGYAIDVPLNQFEGPGHSLNVLVRVTPDGGGPVYLGFTVSLPDAASTKADAELHGSFVVGEGTYSVEALVTDEAARACSSQWRIQAKRTGSERDLKTAAPAGTVQELTPRGPDGAQIQGERAIGRLTILLHAAAINPVAAKLEPETARVLRESLSSLLTQLPAKSVRLVVFNLDKQVVLLNKESFHGRDLEEVSQALDQLELAVVDYRTVQHPERDVLRDLVIQELHNREPASAVILLGPRTGSPKDNSLEGGLPRPGGIPWFYLQYQPRGLPPQTGERPASAPFDSSIGETEPMAGIPDTVPIEPAQQTDGIERLIRRLDGVTLPVRAPHDLAGAIHRMAMEIGAVKEPGEGAVSPLPAPSAAPPAAPTEVPEPVELAGDEDPVEVLAHLRDRVVANAGSVPNHTCVETVQRERYQPLAGRATTSCDNLLASRKQAGNRLRLDVTDWLRLDVGMADGREIFSWAGAAKFEEGEIDELITDGAFATGPFASLLLSAFENRSQHFLFDGETALAGRRVLEYSFRVPRDESHYRVKAQRDWVITGFTGALLVDPRTSDLVRYSVRTEELPPATNICETQTTLDYGLVPLGGLDYLLPTASRQRFIGTDGGEDENSVSFASCREFTGESTLLFGKVPAGAADPFTAPKVAALPAGLPLAIELTSPFTLGKAAAGDRVEGRLAGPLRDSTGQRVLAPAGAKLAGRLTRVELQHSGAGEYTVALRWETLEIEGQRVAVSLKPNRQLGGLKAVARGVLRQRGMDIELPRPGEERDAIYRFPAQRTEVEGGLRTEWVTTTER